MKKHASDKPSYATRPNRKTYVRTYNSSCSRNWSPATRQLDNRSSEEERGDRRGSRAPTDATRPPVSSLIHPRDEKGGRYAVLHRISKRIPVTVARLVNWPRLFARSRVRNSPCPSSAPFHVVPKQRQICTCSFREILSGTSRFENGKTRLRQ